MSYNPNQDPGLNAIEQMHQTRSHIFAISEDLALESLQTYPQFSEVVTDVKAEDIQPAIKSYPRVVGIYADKQAFDKADHENSLPYTRAVIDELYEEKKLEEKKVA